MRQPRYINAYGRNALLLEWEQRIDPEINRSVHAFARLLRHHPAVTECVPAYASLVLTFTEAASSAYQLREEIFCLRPQATIASPPYLHHIPVCYGDVFGPDLAGLSSQTGLDRETLIALHCGTDYLVYFLGFRPGFAFMGETDRRLATARRSTPRTEVAAGSVGLAGRQTGIYPDASPGGWQLIGRCPLPLLDAHTGETRFRAGDRVRFHTVSGSEFVVLESSPPSWPVR